MVQTFMSQNNGLVTLEKPLQPAQVNANEGEWIKSDLDAICLDLHQSSLYSLPQNVRERAFMDKYSRRYRSQCRLVAHDGSIVVRKPSEYPPDQPHESRAIRLQSNSSQSGSILLSIPVEIRLYIYRYLLVSNIPSVVCPVPYGFRLLSPDYSESPLYIYPQILSTCQQINQEATSMLYSENIFRRKFYWRRTYNRKGKQVPWPRSDSSPIAHANLQCLSRIRVFRDYDQWFRDGKFKVISDFPSLKELQVHIDLNDLSNGVNLEKLWKDSMRAIHCDCSTLTCLRTRLRLRFDQRYKDWCNSCAGKQLNFNLHRDKKCELERWMHLEGLFAGKKVSWVFETEVSEYTGPSCVIGFTVEHRSALVANHIKCCLNEHGEKKFYTEAN